MKGSDGIGRLTLIAMNQEGYKNLLELLSLGWLKGQEGDYAVLEWEWVVEHSAGIICLTGATEGEIGRLVAAGQIDKADAVLDKYHAVFVDRLYFELTRVGLSGETALAHYAVQSADQRLIPLVATNVACFQKQTNLRRMKRGSVFTTVWPLMIKGVYIVIPRTVAKTAGCDGGTFL